jgi:hypothetical protein
MVLQALVLDPPLARRLLHGTGMARLWARLVKPFRPPAIVRRIAQPAHHAPYIFVTGTSMDPECSVVPPHDHVKKVLPPTGLFL